MDSTLRTAIILILFAVVIVIIFSPYSGSNSNCNQQKAKAKATETYQNSPMDYHNAMYNDVNPNNENANLIPIINNKSSLAVKRNGPNNAKIPIEKPDSMYAPACMRPVDGSDNQVFSDKIHDDLGQVAVADLQEISKMTMSDDEINTLVSMRPHMNTYIETDGSRFENNNGDSLDKPIDNIRQLAGVVDGYRNNTLETIRGGNTRNLTYPTKAVMYNHLLMY